MCVFSMICVVLKVSVRVSSGGVSTPDDNSNGGKVAMLESRRLCSLSMWAVVAKMFSVSGSVNEETIVGSGSSVFSKVDVTVM